MNNGCNFKTLVDKTGTHISYCTQCKRIVLKHNNLLLCMCRDDFGDFSAYFHPDKFDLYAFPFPDGTNYAVMQTPHSDIQFTFSRNEFMQINQHLAEASLLMEVEVLLGDGRG